MFETDIKNYTLTSVVHSFCPFTAVVPIETFTNKVYIKEANLSVVPPGGVTIGNLTFPGGVEAGANLDIYGFNAEGDLKVLEKEFKIKAKCDKIDTEYFKLSSTTNSSEGPIVDIEFGKTENFKFDINAKANLIGIETGVLMQLTN